MNGSELSMRDEPPCEVMVSRDAFPVANDTVASAWLPVFRLNGDDDRRPMKTSGKESFAVCVPPLFGNISARHLVEFVQLT